MRAMLTLSLVGAALTCGSQIISPAIAQRRQAAAPEPQKVMGPVAPTAAKQPCEGNPDPLGVALRLPQRMSRELSSHAHSGDCSGLPFLERVGTR